MTYNLNNMGNRGRDSSDMRNGGSYLKYETSHECVSHVISFFREELPCMKLLVDFMIGLTGMI